VFISQNIYLLDGKYTKVKKFRLLKNFISFKKGKINKEFALKLNKLDPHYLKRVLEKLTLRLQRSARFHFSLNALLDRVIDDETSLMMTSKSIVDYDDDSGMMLMRRATVTPMRIIYHYPEAFSSNRVVREFKPDLFMRLRFRDEDMRKLNMGSSSSSTFSKMTNIYDRINSLLKSGLYLCGTKYLFLAMSSSQLREHGIFKKCSFYYRPPRPCIWWVPF